MAVEKYVTLPNPAEMIPWSVLTFYECKVIALQSQEYDAGKRLSICIEAPKFKKKYFLYAWASVAEEVLKSGLKEGDYISVHCELSYYLDKEGIHREAYKVISVPVEGKESPTNFSFMRIKRNVEGKKSNASHLSKEELVRMIL